jgi:hypothetical protein
MKECKYTVLLSPVLWLLLLIVAVALVAYGHTTKTVSAAPAQRTITSSTTSTQSVLVASSPKPEERKLDYDGKVIVVYRKVWTPDYYYNNSWLTAAPTMHQDDALFYVYRQPYAMPYINPNSSSQWTYFQEYFDNETQAFKWLNKYAPVEDDGATSSAAAIHEQPTAIKSDELVGIYRLEKVYSASDLKFIEGDEVKKRTIEDRKHWYKWEKK